MANITEETKQLLSPGPTKDMVDFVQPIPEEILSKGLRFSSADPKEELSLYKNVSFNIHNAFLEELETFDLDFVPEIEVQVLSHMYDPKRSVMLKNLIQESKVHDLTNVYRIFTYEDQKHLYEEFEQIKNVYVHYIPLDPKWMTLGGKRQYMFQYNVKNNNQHAFYVEDDCFNLHFPLGAVSKSGNFANKRWFCSYNLAFKFWEHSIKKHDLKFSGLPSNMEFTFRDIFISTVQICQIVHIDHDFAVKNKIEYDQDSGWDDYDFLIQQWIYGEGSKSIMMGYVTPALKAGVSVMSQDANVLAARCAKNTNTLMDKWGSALVRVDSKKGLHNAKINFSTIKRSIKYGIKLTDLINEDNDIIKDRIKILQKESKLAQIEEEKW